MSNCGNWWFSLFCPRPETHPLSCVSKKWVTPELYSAIYVDGQRRDFPGTPWKSFVTGIRLPLTGRLEAVPDGAGLGERPEKSA